MRALESLQLRPYELIQIIAQLGRSQPEDPGEGRLRELIRTIREHPLIPVTLRVNTKGSYREQNPGTGEDTAENRYVNTRRDLVVLQRLGLVPGDTRPAMMLFQRLLAAVEDLAALVPARPNSGVWAAPGRLDSESYRKGRERGLAALFPQRTASELTLLKDLSGKALLAAGTLSCRPHHLLCICCFYGNNVENGLKPIPDDNLFEALHAIQRNPLLPVTLIEGTDDICQPCAAYDPGTSLCLAQHSMSLRDELKDLQLLYLLDLAYGTTLPARELFLRIFTAVANTTQLCGYGDGVTRSLDWSVCGGPTGNPGYLRARKDKLGLPDQ
jgi:hypothetical protein